MPLPEKLPLEFVVDELETLKVIAHSTRLDILQALKLPKTVKEIAKLLKLPATKLYYHVNLMENHGLLQVVETNIVSGIIEKKYQVVANNYRIDHQLLATQPPAAKDLDQMLSAIFDVTRAEIQRTVQQTEQNPFDPVNGMVWRATLKLTAEQYADFYGRFATLLAEMDKLNTEAAADTAVSDQTRYGLTIAYYPIQPLDE